MEKPLKDKIEILICFLVVGGVLEQRLNMSLARVFFAAAVVCFCFCVFLCAGSSPLLAGFL